MDDFLCCKLAVTSTPLESRVKHNHMQNSQTETTTGRCVACGNSLAFFGRRGQYTYRSCKACESIQLAPFPSKEDLNRAYIDDYATSGHQGSDPDAIYQISAPYYAAVLRELNRTSHPAGVVLDLGCGWGGMCRYLKGAGYDYLGTDYPSASIEYCRQIGLNVRDASLDDLLSRREHFSVVLMVTVFEHPQDHAETLRKIHGILKPGGLVLILIPTAGLFGRLARMIRWIRQTDDIPAMNTTFCPPWHTAIFSLEGVHHLFTANGFELVRVQPSPSGNSRGLVGLVQRAATLIAKTGFAVFGTHWPFVLNHIFVYRAR